MFVKNQTLYDFCMENKDKKYLLDEWDYEKNEISPNEITIGSGQKIYWLCNKGHSYIKNIPNKLKGQNCPYCNGYRILIGFNDLCTTHPNLIKEWDFSKNNLKPNEISYGSSKKVWWLCEKGHSYEMIVSNKVKGQGCPYCSGRYAIKGETDLCNSHPELLNEWDYEKNILKPEEVLGGSNKKVWWLCSNGHSFDMRVRDRTKGGNCPYCSGHRVLKGYNDLLTTHPHLIKEWDFSKNNIKPDEVMSGSGKKVWWKCEKDHSYDMLITNKIKGQLCPICSGKRVLKGYNDLATLRPELLKEWNYEKNKIKPEEITVGSGKKVWWTCEKGHSYQAVIKLKCRPHSIGCSICKKESKTSFPEQALFYYIKKSFSCAISGEKEILKTHKLELDIYIPDKYIAVEYDGYAWHCNEENKNNDINKNLLCKDNGITLIRVREIGLSDLKNSINIFRKDIRSDESLEEVIKQVLITIGGNVDVNINRDRQFIYSQYVKKEKENSLLFKYPEIAKEWHPLKNGALTPETVSYASNKKVWWQCEKGHEYQKTVGHRIRNKLGCPYCSGTKVLKGFNDLCSSYPKLMEEWDFSKNIIKPDEIYKHSMMKVWWLCDKGHSFEQTIFERATENRKCPHCYPNRSIRYENITITHPHLIKEWNFEKNKINITEVTAGSSKKVWWKCKNGHSFEQIVSSHVLNKNNCPYCSGQKLLKGFNDLSTTHPEVLKEWDYEKNDLKPDEVSKGQNKKVWWICENGHSYESTINNHIGSNNGCPYCVGKKILEGYNDLATTHPDLLKEWDYMKNSIKPTEISKGSNKEVWWLCSVGHSFKASVSNRAIGKQGCPYCSNKKILEGYNDVGTTHPELLKYWDYEKNTIKPSEITKGSDKKVWFIKEGKTYNTTIYNFLKCL